MKRVHIRKVQGFARSFRYAFSQRNGSAEAIVSFITTELADKYIKSTDFFFIFSGKQILQIKMT